MNARIIILSFGLLFTVPASHACINTYAFDLGREGLDEQSAQAELKNLDKSF